MTSLVSKIGSTTLVAKFWKVAIKFKIVMFFNFQVFFFLKVYIFKGVTFSLHSSYSDNSMFSLLFYICRLCFFDEPYLLLAAIVSMAAIVRETNSSISIMQLINKNYS